MEDYNTIEKLEREIRSLRSKLMDLEEKHSICYTQFDPNSNTGEYTVMCLCTVDDIRGIRHLEEPKPEPKKPTREEFNGSAHLSRCDGRDEQEYRFEFREENGSKRRVFTTIMSAENFAKAITARVSDARMELREYFVPITPLKK